MRTYQDIEFEKRVNKLRLESLQRLAVDTDPRTADFESIVQEIRVLEEKQKELAQESIQKRYFESIDNIAGAKKAEAIST